MKISTKFIWALWLSILFIALVNIVAFYVFYTTYLKIYFTEKVNSREKITLDYINDIKERQAIDEIWSIFYDVEIEIFELFEENNWEIILDDDKKINLVVDYLIKSWVGTKYIEEIIPTNNFKKVIDAIYQPNSPENKFVSNLSRSIIITNVVAITLTILVVLWFIQSTISPLRNVAEKIKISKTGKDYKKIEYKNPNDEVWLLIWSINNLNQRLNLQDQIRWRLLADISHELKTPITSIQCYLEWITDGVIKLDQKNLNAITDEMKRLIVMVNKIMEHEKLERERLDLHKEELNIYDIITQIVETHKKRLKENKQRIKVNWDINQLFQADKDLFMQLVHNLIWNFLKYAWKKTILRINITKTYIEFSDDWNGIKSSEIPFITEKFYQGKIEKTWDIETRWIWVWLSITKKIIESHDWRYDVKSDLWKWFHFKIYI